MKESDKYHRWVEWNEEDRIYLGKCPDLITGIHGEDPIVLYSELCTLVEDVVSHFKAGGLGMAPEVTMFYPIVVHKDPDSDYGVSVPDLPGCISAATTLNEAIEAAKDAIECHLEGMLIDSEPVPMGREIDYYREDPEWADGIWGLVQVDLSKLSGKSRRVDITLPERLLSQVDRFASSHGDTLSGFLAHAALEYMQQHQSDES